ncbi:MAG: hypothetical protein ACQSGP_01605 [Frankia sp.]
MDALRRPAAGVAVDQAIFSATSLLMNVQVAKAVTTSEFGRFSTGTLAFILALGIGRALVGQVLVITCSGEDRAFIRAAAGGQLPRVSAIAVVLVTGVLAVLLTVGGNSVEMAAVCALSVAPMLFQDFFRMVALAAGAIRALIALDAVWLVMQTVLLSLLDLFGMINAANAWAAIGISVLIAALLGFLMLRPTRTGLRVHRLSGGLGLTLASDYAASSGLSVGLSFLVPLLSGPSALAAVRSAQTAAAPAQVLQMAVESAVLPSAAKAARSSHRDAVRVAVLGSLFGSLVVLLYFSVSFLIPSRYWSVLLGDSWQVGRGLLPPTALRALFAFIAIGPVIALRSTGGAGRALRARLVTTPVLLAGAVIGVSLYGAFGFAVGIAGAQIAAAMVWWLMLVKSTRERPAPHRRTTATRPRR